MDSQAQQHLIAQRVAYFRSLQGLNQHELSQRMNFNQRQTLSDIERGERKVTANELKKFAEIFGISPLVLIDAFVPATNVEFSWRTASGTEALQVFEQRGRNIINLISTLRTKLEKAPAPTATLPLGENSRYEDAAQAAEHLVERYNLGDRPAKRLLSLYESLGLDCIHLDLPASISGAAIVTDVAVIAVINAFQVRGRRHFDMAHELFHCMTWRTMPPKHIDPIIVKTGKKRSRTEELADVFAGALLMPGQALRNALPSDASMAQLMRVADDFEVSVDALIWRMVSLHILTKDEAQQLLAQPHQPGNGNPQNFEHSSLLSPALLQLLAEALTAGIISVRRAAELIEISIDGLAATYAQHQLPVPFDL